MDLEEIEKQKKGLLSVARWAAREAGVKVVFDSQGMNATASVDTRTIHMPKAIPVDMVGVATTTIIHEAMHMKHTPMHLGYVARSKADKIIINALEDRRIELEACSQLPGLHVMLGNSLKRLMAGRDLSDVKTSMKVLGNLASEASKITVFGYYGDECSVIQGATPIINKLKRAHYSLCTSESKKVLEERIKEYYTLLDSLKKVLDMKDEPLDDEEQSEGEGDGDSGEDGDGSGYHDGGNILDELLKSISSKVPSRGKSDNIDMTRTDASITEFELSDMARQRVKDALMVSVSKTLDDGTDFRSDNITSFYCGDVEDLFHEKVKEKQIRTKIYFLFDCSGSMDVADIDDRSFDDVLSKSKLAGTTTKAFAKNGSRFKVAAGAMNSLRKVVDEVAEASGGDISYDIYMFADDCQKWQNPSYSMSDSPHGDVGGGTSITRAMDKVFKDIRIDNPADKRIMVVITDGDVNRPDVEGIKELVNKEAQDIRVVFVAVGGHCSFDAELSSKESIDSVGKADEVVFTSFERAL